MVAAAVLHLIGCVPLFAVLRVIAWWPSWMSHSLPTLLLPRDTSVSRGRLGATGGHVTGKRWWLTPPPPGGGVSVDCCHARCVVSMVCVLSCIALCTSTGALCRFVASSHVTHCTFVYKVILPLCIACTQGKSAYCSFTVGFIVVILRRVA
jgi:hypothetical protein